MTEAVTTTDDDVEKINSNNENNNGNDDKLSGMKKSFSRIQAILQETSSCKSLVYSWWHADLMLVLCGLR
jgi:hypothetical protein